MEKRSLSLAHAVSIAGGVDAWNKYSPTLIRKNALLDNLCKATNIEEARAEVEAVMETGSQFLAYAYMRRLYEKNLHIYYGVIADSPTQMLPIVYTPTVGEACQKFGSLPMQRRGCYVSIKDQGNIKAVLEDYARSECRMDPNTGKFLCECIVFSDGGRILGLGDLGTWGMGIPVGKLDLYTVCAGIDPQLTIPVIIDAGCTNFEGNTDKLVIRDNSLYTGLREDRITHKTEVGTTVNSKYYGEGNLIEEFMNAATDLFGDHCLLQFEDFNSNDAFPLLETYKDKFLTYNDDIQGTAAVTVAGLLGAIKLNDPDATDLIAQLGTKRFLFHGAGSANIGAMRLLVQEANVPKSNIFVTNSRGLIWKDSENGNEGSFRNNEQKEFAHVGKPSFDNSSLKAIVEAVEPAFLVGAVGRDPGCITKEVVEAMVKVNKDRPAIFALSNPKSKAEITSTDCWKWSNGRVIYGSGTAMDSMEIDGKLHCAGQVNNVYIFPGVSMGAVRCKARNIPDSFFMAAAEAVANSLSQDELDCDRIVPHPDRIRDVGLNVATAIVVDAQNRKLCDLNLGSDVKTELRRSMWEPRREAQLRSQGGLGGILTAIYELVCCEA